ncbi:MAG: MerR family transcriptional regulator [Gaiellaceae bacterium MAG52_C11]|nr:MerR family transcriptional regulator [Candidatus Gaiellasilicea maunaloa]
MENAGTLTVGAALDDPARLHALTRIRVGSASDSAVFDRLTALVTSLLDVPIALLTLVAPESQSFISVAGVEQDWQRRGAVPVTDTFCHRTVRFGAPLAIDDARTDSRAREARSVFEHEVVAYLGIPLVTASGHAVGTFCAVDTAAREWSENDVRVLSDLAATAIAYVESRPATPAETSPGGLNIAAVSHRTGVAPDTLRKWERRYGILHPHRTAGGQRRYDDIDVSRVKWLRDRLSEGIRIGAAAALLESAHGDSAENVDELREALVAAASEGDPSRLLGLVEQTFTLHPFVVAIDEILAPALRTLGDAWESGSETIAEEHLLSGAVRSRLERMLSDRRSGVHGTAVLACAPGEQHELGLLAVAVMLQADGWLVVYLGADLPADAAISVARRIDADVVCLSVTLPESLARLAAELEEAPGDRPLVVAGGPGVALAGTKLPARLITGGLADVAARLRST